MSDTPPEEFRNMEDLLRRVLSQALGPGQVRPGIIGVNIIMAGGLPPGFPGGSGGGGPGRDVEHPEIEVTEWDGRVMATCELKGLCNEHISIAFQDKTLHIIGYDGKTRYRSSVELPPVIESSCNRTFQNGVLELTWLMGMVDLQAPHNLESDITSEGESQENREL
jgi:hypothetical protein